MIPTPTPSRSLLELDPWGLDRPTPLMAWAQPRRLRGVGLSKPLPAWTNAQPESPDEPPLTGCATFAAPNGVASGESSGSPREDGVGRVQPLCAGERLLTDPRPLSTYPALGPPPSRATSSLGSGVGEPTGGGMIPPPVACSIRSPLAARRPALRSSRLRGPVGSPEWGACASRGLIRPTPCQGWDHPTPKSRPAGAFNLRSLIAPGDPGRLRGQHSRTDPYRCAKG